MRAFPITVATVVTAITSLALVACAPDWDRNDSSSGGDSLSRTPSAGTPQQGGRTLGKDTPDPGTAPQTGGGLDGSINTGDAPPVVVGPGDVEQVCELVADCVGVDIELCVEIADELDPAQVACFAQARTCQDVFACEEATEPPGECEEVGGTLFCTDDETGEECADTEDLNCTCECLALG